MDDKGREKKELSETFAENTPLFPLMSKVCHVLMFLYGAAYWIQIGVFPVSVTDKLEFMQNIL